MKRSNVGNIGPKEFLKNAEILDHFVLRPLDHIRANWELTWDEDAKKYLKEEDSFSELLNQLMDELEDKNPPLKYHDNEDRLAEYVIKHLGWKIKKVGKRWIGEEYPVILEQGGFHDIDQEDLVLAAAGRIKAAIERGQVHFDDMEKSHRKILAGVLSVILYHRMNDDIED